MESRGFSGKHAEDAATVFANNSLDGVYSHGVNRFPRVVEYLDKGEIDSGAIASCESSMGAIERWNGHRGFGPLNAKLAMDRAVELAKEYGVGVVALGNNNHWMRGGSYGWQAAEGDASVSAGPTPCPTCLPGAERTERSETIHLSCLFPEAAGNMP